MFLDVREPRYYTYGHIERAINLPLEDLSKIEDSRIASWKEAPALVIYCNGISCGAGYQAARSLMERGLDNVKIYVEGWPEWRSCQLPITMSAQMKQDVSPGGR